MSAEGAGIAGIGIKTGLFIALAAAAVSIIAVMVGFTIVPLQPGHELRDAGRRLAGGLLASFMLGPFTAAKAVEWFPGYLVMWHTAIPEPAWAYFIAGAPFIAITGVVGFWIVAAFVRWFARRADKDIGELVDDIRKGGTP